PSSVFMAAVLGFLLFTAKGFSISRDEAAFIIVPICAFIVWSAVSMLWAPSTASVLHHTLMWCLYLSFYLVVRGILEKNDRSYDVFLTALSLVFVFYSIPAVIEYCGFLVFGGSTTLGIRFAKYGEQINTLMPLVLVAAVRSEGKKFVLWSVAIVMFWLLIVCSLGRINMIVFVILAVMMIGTVLIFARFRSYLRKALIIVGACILSAVIV